jgi:uncharacterized protein (TIGR02145 family)
MHKHFFYFLTFFIFFINYIQAQSTTPSLTIGTQIWSTNNLNVSKFRNGDIIPQAKTEAEWVTAGNKQKPAWCYYNNDSANGKEYGKLYNWYAVNDPRGLAPKGWHVPNEGDWNKLVKYLDVSADTTCRDCSPSKIVGGMMKSTSLWNYPNLGASNSSGFSANPAGFRTPKGEFMWIGNYGYWWSSKEFNDINAWYTHLVYDNSSIIKNFSIEKKFGFSVRLIKGESPKLGQSTKSRNSQSGISNNNEKTNKLIELNVGDEYLGGTIFEIYSDGSGGKVFYPVLSDKLVDAKRYLKSEDLFMADDYALQKIFKLGLINYKIYGGVLWFINRDISYSEGYGMTAESIIDLPDGYYDGSKRTGEIIRYGFKEDGYYGGKCKYVPMRIFSGKPTKYK